MGCKPALAAITMVMWITGVTGTALAAGPAEEACSAGDLSAAVDTAGGELRAFNAKALPPLRERLEKLGVKRGWPAEEREERGLAEIEDGHIAALDTQSNDLLSKIDALGRPPEGGVINCGQVSEVKASSAKLLGLMKEKSEYSLVRLDRALGVAPAAEAPSGPQPQAAKPVAKPKPDAKPTTPPWETTAETPVAAGPVVPPGPGGLSPDAFTPDFGDDGYSIEEIRDATKGFFGTISTNLATVLEHAFSVAGRPTAYVLGTEGGGAFLAGLRYGEGKLFMRSGGTSQVYWHGPSIGTDFGASGSRTLFLIYKLKQPDDLFRTFTGLDGSAYLVGGIGLTLMKGGKVVMAPIRSGLGLRFGANIGYVRFTPKATWNPF